mgnify:CR=1 FL=1
MQRLLTKTLHLPANIRLEKENEQLRNALQKAVNSAQAEENEGEDDEESDEIIRKMRQQQISLFD